MAKRTLLLSSRLHNKFSFFSTVAYSIFHSKYNEMFLNKNDSFSTQGKTTMMTMKAVRVIVLAISFVPILLSEKRSYEFQAIYGRDIASVKPNIRIIMGRSKIDCVFGCLETTDCGGFNYRHLAFRIVKCDLKSGMSLRNRTGPENWITYYEKTGISSHTYTYV